MKAITKKLLLASVAFGVMTPFLTGGAVVHAEYNPPSAASNNEVIVNNGNYSINGTSYNFTNPLTNTWGTIWGATAGATSFTNNIFTINGGTLQGSILGAVYSPDGFASYNTLNLNGGTFLEFGPFFGANANTLAQGNIINIGSGVTFPTDYFFIHGGYATTATENTINVNGDIDNSSAHIAAGNATDSAYSNVVNINSGTVNLSHIYGAFSNNLVSGNKLNINGGTVTTANDIAGGYINSDSGTAEGNEVNITAGNINVGGRIFGGYGINSATKNSVNISGGTINSQIYGGTSRTGSVTNNTINIYNNPDLSNAYLYGGYVYEGGTVSGNALNIYTKNLTAKNISNFDAVNFYLQNNVTNGDTILTLTDSSGTDLSGVAIKAGVVAGNANLNDGDTVTLITNSNGLTTDSTTYGKLTEGVSLDYDLTVSKSGNSIIAAIGTSSVKSETESLPLSSGIPGLETVNTSLDTKNLEDDTEFESKEAAAATQIVEPKGWEIFANMGGGSLKTKGSDGSHVDMTTQSINLGFARSLESSAGKFTIAPIIDYASGKYDSYLETGIHGNGKTRYIAGGLIARRMLSNGFYYETSVRVGKVKTDFESDNLDTTGAFGRVTYDASATTLAGHLKLGKAFRLNKNNFLDVYGIYYHAHQNGMGADLSSGEHYDFSSADSGRFRLGYRLTTRTSKISKIYTGLAFQYEHSSGITATYKTYSTAGKGESGSSGMLEIGWIIKPLKALPWAVDINATGWIGHQRGVTAFAKVQKAF